MIADRSQKNLIATVRLLDDDDIPITGRTYADAGLDVRYKKPGEVGWNQLTLVAGTLNVYGDSHWIEDDEDDGLYELGIPDDSYVPGKRTLWKLKHGTNNFRFFAIDYVAIPSVETNIPKFEFSIPGSSTIVSNAPRLYTAETGIEVQFTATQDIESEVLEIIFESNDKVDKYTFTDGEITKSGNTATITLPSDFTDATKTLNWAIREDTTRRVYGIGTISVTYAPQKDP